MRIRFPAASQCEVSTPLVNYASDQQQFACDKLDSIREEERRDSMEILLITVEPIVSDYFA